MASILWIGMCVFFVVIQKNTAEVVDINPLDYAFTSDRLPEEKLMCSIGNGHVHTNVFSTDVFMSGFFSGESSKSHTLRLPAWNNVLVNVTSPFQSLDTKYTLDTSTGTFVLKIESEDLMLEQKLFAHKYYSRALINQITVQTSFLIEAKIELIRNFGPPVEGLWMPGYDTNMIINGRRVIENCGSHYYEEDPRPQKKIEHLCMFRTEVQKYISVKDNERLTYTHVFTVDTKREVALKEMTDILYENPDDLYSKHTSEWEIINKGKVKIEGNLKLAKVVNGMWYYLMSSMPSLNTNQPKPPFAGWTGASYSDFGGHVSWDQEAWMLPVALIFQPTWAKDMLNYRLNRYDAAKDLAISSKNEGIRFPWRSGSTGIELNADPQTNGTQLHVNGWISFAIRQYITMTNDYKWLEEGGLKLVLEIADFWASRVKFNNDTRMNHINGVMGPDQSQGVVNNSALTNVLAGYSLRLGNYLSCHFGKPYKNWNAIASTIPLLIDKTFNYHPVYEGYKRPKPLQQADVMLIVYPLQYMPLQITREDLNYYGNVTGNEGSMTWSMHTISRLKKYQFEEAGSIFSKSYAPHVMEPFKVWNSAAAPGMGYINYLTGMAGFMQTLIYGYGGINIEFNNFYIMKPTLPPGTTELKISGIKYFGAEFTLTVTKFNSLLSVDRYDDDRNETQALILTLGYITMPLRTNITVMLRGWFETVIRPASNTMCPPFTDEMGWLEV